MLLTDPESAPLDNADYFELWDSVRNQTGLSFIPFDVKVLSLKQGTGTRVSNNQSISDWFSLMIARIV